MKFTVDWLKEHLETTLSENEIAKALVDIGLEVESLTNTAQKFDNFVLGQILETRTHPNAERLNLCLVDIGSKKVEVVCGAPNVRPMMNVVYANVGAVIPATQEALKPAKIRGIESCGMLCSAEELMFEASSEGILDLETSLPVGTPIAKIFGSSDVIVDLSITPNRSDCFSVRGVARDLSAKGCGFFNKLTPVKEYKEDALVHAPAISQLFTACIKGVKNCESPAFIQDRMKAVGMNPKNFLVDITNYLSLNFGQPLHVHDAKTGTDLTARFAKPGETMMTLKDQLLELTKNDILITSGDKILALGGVMGSHLSAVNESTVDIVVESAHFDPIQNALSGQYHNIHTDSRMRFERGVDPLMVRYAFYKTIEMILEYCGGTVEWVRVKSEIPNKKVIIFHMDTFKKKCGFEMSRDTAINYLEKLEFVCAGKGEDALVIDVPLFRHDVSIEEDIVEELLRMEGLDKLPSQALDLKPVHMDTKLTIKDKMVASGLHEAYTWSMISEKEFALFSKEEPIRINNPLNQNMGVMRPTILTGLVKAALENQNKGSNQTALFEVAKVYPKEGEFMMCAGLRSGDYNKRAWNEKARSVDVFDIKADCLAVLPSMKMQTTREVPFYYHPTKSGALKQGKNVLAYFGELHPSIIKDYGLKGDVVAFEIFTDRIPVSNKKIKMGELSPYPSVPRDLCFVMDKSVMVDEVVQTIQKVSADLIHDVSVFDVYEKKDETTKSVAVEFYYQSNTKTLHEKEIAELTEGILAVMKSKFNAVLRG